MHSATNSAEFAGPGAVAAGARRYGVAGSPIEHSLSPALHTAAYRVLGLGHHYGRHELVAEELPGFVASLDEHWGGLSLTMPLKRAVLELADTVEPVAKLLDSANTLVLTPEGSAAYNTDVPGVQAALADAGITDVATAHILGGGATANSVLAALVPLGLRAVVLTLRDAARAEGFRALAEQLGVTVSVQTLGDAGVLGAGLGADLDAALIVNTIPAAVGFPITVDPAVRSRVPLFEVSYSPWPSPAGTMWQDAGGLVIPGIDMLIHQALVQLRIFLQGNPTTPLAHEDQVLAAMQAVVARVPGQPWHGVPQH